MNSTLTSTVEQHTSDGSCSALTEHASEHNWLSQETDAARHPSPHDAPALKPMKRKHVERKRLTVSLPLDLLERSRNTVYWTKGLTLARLLEQALTHSLDLRERMNGQPFPQRLDDLKGGRPRRRMMNGE